MKKKPSNAPALSRRETQIMDIVYANSECSAADVQDGLPDAPSYSTVRKLLTILVDKGHLKFNSVAGKYMYQPTTPRPQAGKSALARVLTTFYEGSLEQAVAAMLSSRDANVSDDELQRLADLIAAAKRKEKK